MSRRIKNYEELLVEERRLTAQLTTTKMLIKEDISGIKAGLNPFRNVMNVFKKFTSRDKKGTLMNVGVDFSIDLLLRRLLLARAGWLTKVVIPYAVKNFSSHFITEEKRSVIVNKAQELFQKIKSKFDKTQN